MGTIRPEVSEDLKKFEAVLAEWTGWNCTIRRITFEIEDGNAALEAPEDRAAELLARLFLRAPR